MTHARISTWPKWAAIVSVILCAFGVGWLLSPRVSSSSSSAVRPLPNVLMAVRALARLESVSYHMERIIDRSDRQSRLFGLIESEDALLLVAVANVTAGVDLEKMDLSAMQVDHGTRSGRVHLPTPEIFPVALDNEHTYVHTRRTGLMAQRKEDLEARARAEAERALLDAARQAAILPVAAKNAQRTVTALLHSLGFEHVEVTVALAPE